ncbi:MAG: hypothetical protein IT269_04990, partial [Saprospiraceae bacterium]|nr:hypothetical protein [Saprospiraceae bacterium]
MSVLTLLCAGLMAQTTVTFSSAAGATSIPDGAYNGTVASMATKTLSVSLPAGKLVKNVRVFANISHDASGGSPATDNCSGGDGTGGWVGDMTIKMVLPDATVMGLMSRPGLLETADGAGECCGNSADLLKSSPDLIFSDAGAISSEGMGGAGTTDGLGNISVFSYTPSKGIIASPYTNFASLIAANCLTDDLNGTWTLGVGDGALFDAGCFTQWTIEITYDEACILVVPADVTINLAPGACDANYSYNVSTTGVCVESNTIIGFNDYFAPSSVDAYQNDAQGPAGAGQPPFANNYSTTFDPG